MKTTEETRPLSLAAPSYWSLADVAARDVPMKPKAKPTERLTGKGSKQPHKGSRDIRKAPWKADVIKVRLDLTPFSEPQIKWLIKEGRCALAYQQRVAKDDRGFDQFRREVVSEATAEHKAGQAHGLSEKSGATKAHFNAIMSAFKLLQNEGGEALEWAQKDGDEALLLSLLRHLVRGRLSWLNPVQGRTLPEEIQEDQQAYGDDIARKQYGRPWMSLDAPQLDWFYRTLKESITRRRMEAKAAAWMEKQQVAGGVAV